MAWRRFKIDLWGSLQFDGVRTDAIIVAKVASAYGEDTNAEGLTVLASVALQRGEKMLAEKVAIITGASRGIGRAVGLELARNGASVALSSRTAGACEPVAARIRTEGGNAISITCDVSQYTEVTSLIGKAYEHYGRVDILVNNAGVIEPMGYLEACNPDSWAQNISINLVGVFHGCRAVFSGFRRAGQGVIINLSSDVAHRPIAGWSAYCTGKAGVAMLTQVLAREAEDSGVRVYGLRPGVVDTDMQQEIRESNLNEASRIPRETNRGPEEPARVVSWLCTEEAVDLVGKELSIEDRELRRRAGLGNY